MKVFTIDMKVRVGGKTERQTFDYTTESMDGFVEADEYVTQLLTDQGAELVALRISYKGESS